MLIFALTADRAALLRDNLFARLFTITEQLVNPSHDVNGDRGRVLRTSDGCMLAVPLYNDVR